MSSGKPHPLRCETCGNREINPNDDWFCKVTGEELAGEIEVETHRKYGCASHSSAQPAGEAEQCPYWKSTANLKSDFRDQNLGRFYCSRPLEQEKAAAIREAQADALRDFDYWFSGRHVGGQSPIIPEVRQELWKRIEELRPESRQQRGQ